MPFPPLHAQPDWLSHREKVIQQHFGLPLSAQLRDSAVMLPEMTPALASHFARFNLEWHVVPSATCVPFDNTYCARMYPHAPTSFWHGRHAAPGLWEMLAVGHRLHQGRLVAIETTMKPGFLPANRQHYGSAYGLDNTADPLIEFIDRSRLISGTRFGNQFPALKALVETIDRDWRARALLPQGYRVTVCPPVIFNLIGTLFHEEWSETPSLEVGWYAFHDGAQCYAAGSAARGDFSFIVPEGPASDWNLAGFRLALVPEHSAEQRSLSAAEQEAPVDIRPS